MQRTGTGRIDKFRHAQLIRPRSISESFALCFEGLFCRGCWETIFMELG